MRRLDFLKNSTFKAVSFCLVVVLVSIIVGLTTGIMGLKGILIVVPLGLLFVAFPGLQYRFEPYFAYMGLISLGYMFAGKGFAYIGVYPVFVSEIGLGLAGFLILVELARHILGYVQGINVSFSAFALVTLLIWQFGRFLPDLGHHGISAIRDSVLWLYALYALAIYLAGSRSLIRQAFRVYSRLVPIYLVWLAVMFVLTRLADGVQWRFPGAPVSIVHLKSGDVGVHLAGVGAFMLLFWSSQLRLSSIFVRLCFWSLWLFNWFAYGSSNRGGMFSALIGLLVVMFLRPAKSRWYTLVYLLILGVLLLSITGLDIQYSDKYSFSLEQIWINVRSTFGEGYGKWEGTRQWRLAWWRAIINYTINGSYFWFGKGYGVNLALSDGFVVSSAGENRHPHNGHLNFLARSGIPGFVLWLLFLGSVILVLLRSVYPNRSLNQFDRNLGIWFLAYWLAFLFNASFDVFLEGPQGGVPFWCLVGAILAYFAPISYEKAYD